ncbi:two-component system chemotaxis response regulator CheB [Sphingomonas jinjuensis]|uniref:protein-glutamate methylesterase n=1 Tax=Sphingomonas jinjuensis TaxID=535907 RepID=A0A840F4X4_9SPHN|nr:chemotaxis-specific protein-glutamate methyltransferase CheB [Sphingomonas jinjuensis]MBB4152849.1 two-component system chemotaxis response regulator CheB [Sphingomonas jinjuensis]
MAASPSPRAMAPDTERVLIVDDSAVSRAVLARIIDASDRFAAVGAVPTASAALAFLERERVDVVLLDVEMPGMDGLTALPQLLAAGQGARIIVVSSLASDGAESSIRAMALGAADTLVKPPMGQRLAHFSDMLLEKLMRLSRRGPAAMPRATGAEPATPARSSAAPQDDTSPVAVPALGAFDIVTIGASTGGIHALSQLLRELPPSFRQPIVITQHLPGSFMPYFAAQIAVLGQRPCDVATDRMRVRPGRIIVAPGDAHVGAVSLGDGAAAVRLLTEPASSGCMPSIDPMLASFSDVYGARMVAVILSGMGRDGAEGVRNVRDAGGKVLVQDQASSVVWGMPGTVAQAGHADAILPPASIGRALAARRPS